jgi:large-conductance mechanosensitive channel
MEAAVKDFLVILEKPYNELNGVQKVKRVIGIILIGIFTFVIIMVINKSREKARTENEKRKKLKYFKPTIEEGVFSKRITWVMRDTPLSDELLDELVKEI